MNNKFLKYSVYSAVFAALICVVTIFVKFTGVGGYYHAGDAFIYVAAVCLPFPYASFAGAIGGAFADMFSGFPQYMLPTFIIKFALALVFSRKTPRILCERNIAALFLASLISVVGYYVTAVILTNSLVVSTETFYGNIIQAALSAIIFVALNPALQKIRQKIFN